MTVSHSSGLLTARDVPPTALDGVWSVSDIPGWHAGAVPLRLRVGADGTRSYEVLG
jgi:hypothetical protein